MRRRARRPQERYGGTSSKLSRDARTQGGQKRRPPWLAASFFSRRGAVAGGLVIPSCRAADHAGEQPARLPGRGVQGRRGRGAQSQRPGHRRGAVCAQVRRQVDAAGVDHHGVDVGAVGRMGGSTGSPASRLTCPWKDAGPVTLTAPLPPGAIRIERLVSLPRVRIATPWPVAPPSSERKLTAFEGAVNCAAARPLERAWTAASFFAASTSATLFSGPLAARTGAPLPQPRRLHLLRRRQRGDHRLPHREQPRQHQLAGAGPGGDRGVDGGDARRRPPIPLRPRRLRQRRFGPDVVRTRAQRAGRDLSDAPVSRQPSVKPLNCRVSAKVPPTPTL